jgi:hypothetical protein
LQDGRLLVDFEANDFRIQNQIVLEDVIDAEEALDNPAKAQRLYSGLEIVAVASSGTSMGDLLVSIEEIQGLEHAFLVLRHSNGNYYDIVGQAFSQASFTDTGTSTNLYAKAKLNFTAEDATVLLAQDFIGCDKAHGGSNAMLRYARLKTRVSSNSTRAACIEWANEETQSKRARGFRTRMAR